MPTSLTPTPTPTRTIASNAPGALDRVLPHSADAERALLGSMLLDEAAIGEALSILRDVGRRGFFFERNGLLFEHIVELYDQRKPLDGVVIKDELLRRGVFESLGGYEYLGELATSVPSALRVRHYADIVRDKFLLRELIRAAHQTMEAAYDARRTTPEILDFAEQVIFSTTERRVTGAATPLPELMEQLLQMLRERGDKPLTGEPTGYYELDDLTSGFQPSELLIVAGRPSMGKTAFGLNVAENMAIDHGVPVLFFSLEMSHHQIAQRILCSRARVSSHDLRRGRCSKDDYQALHAAAEQLRTVPLLIDDSANISILELRARARMAHRKHKLRAIFVDYLQLLRSPGAESRQVEVAEISRGLKALAKELNVPVVAMAQLNRNPEDRGNNRPRMGDLRESGAIEQDADVVALLHRESYYKQGDDPAAAEDNSAELIIAKQRNGPVGTVQLLFSRHWTRFENYRPGGQYDHVDTGTYASAPPHRSFERPADYVNPDGPGLSKPGDGDSPF